MSDESGLLSSIPDQPLTKSVVESIDDVDGVRRAISPTWQSPISGEEGEYTEDLIIITDERVRYLSRERGEGWSIKRDEHYADDEEFEAVMDDVHDFAVEYSQQRIKRNVEEDYGE